MASNRFVAIRVDATAPVSTVESRDICERTCEIRTSIRSCIPDYFIVSIFVIIRVWSDTHNGNAGGSGILQLLDHLRIMVSNHLRIATGIGGTTRQYYMSAI